ncbi:MAG: hypothetical protein GY879_05510 [Planctomycetes bacterium]|nr:hypothetical protein [Planctomycetota bacterium]
MKNAFFAMSLFGIGTALLSCNMGGAGVSSPDTGDSFAHSSQADSLAELHGLTLNQGARWQLDEHLRTTFVKMEASFSSSNLADLSQPELKEIGGELQQGIQELIQGCTMVGEAHDQLHGFLTGYIPAVASLSASGLKSDADRVGHYFEAYHQYFE